MPNEQMEAVSIATSDLEDIRNALNIAYFYSVSEDIMKGYREMREKPRYSALTNSLQASVSKADEYLALAQMEEEDEADDSE